jgi:hypothetical protein
MAEWMIGSTRIYVLDENETVKQQIARLQPLSTGTIHHIFGYEDAIIKISCKVVGKTNFDALKALRATGVTTTLTGDIETRTVYVSSVDGKRNRAYWQTLDILQDCTTPVYDVELELFEEI